MDSTTEPNVLQLMEEYNLALVPVRVYADCTTELSRRRGEYLRTLWAVTSPESKRCYITGEAASTGWMEACWARRDLFETPIEAVLHGIAELQPRGVGEP
jgi:hypothetical protein